MLKNGQPVYMAHIWRDSWKQARGPLLRRALPTYAKLSSTIPVPPWKAVGEGLVVRKPGFSFQLCYMHYVLTVVQTPC